MGRLSNLLPELAPLWQAVHNRLSSGRPVSRVRFGPLDGRQRAALADLLGISKMPGEYPVVSLPELDQILTTVARRRRPEKCGYEIRAGLAVLRGEGAGLFRSRPVCDAGCRPVTARPTAGSRAHDLAASAAEALREPRPVQGRVVDSRKRSSVSESALIGECLSRQANL